MAEASVEEIDRINILQASLLAMQRAVAALAVRADSALVDGNRCPQLDIPVEAMIKGDGKIASIAAASILAKTVRDAGMLELHAAVSRSTALTATWAIRRRCTCRRWRRTAPRRCTGAASRRSPQLALL